MYFYSTNSLLRVYGSGGKFYYTNGLNVIYSDVHLFGIKIDMSG